MFTRIKSRIKHIKDFLNSRIFQNQELKEKIFIIIFEADTPKGKLFDVALIWCIVLSILLVIFESMKILPESINWVLIGLEYLLTFFFTMEYVLRIYCVRNPWRYIFSFFGIIDLLATLPFYLGIFFNSTRYLIIIRTFRLIRVFRIFKLFSFYTEGNLLLRSLRISLPKIIVFFLFVLILVISMGTVMYMIEGNLPNTQFHNIPESIYWAIVTMTTVGYGDITPISPIGKFFSAMIMLLGYTIIAVPTGIVSASMVSEHTKKQRSACPECGRFGHDDLAIFCKYCGAPLNPKMKKGMRKIANIDQKLNAPKRHIQKKSNQQ